MRCNKSHPLVQIHKLHTLPEEALAVRLSEGEGGLISTLCSCIKQNAQTKQKTVGEKCDSGGCTCLAGSVAGL